MATITEEEEKKSGELPVSDNDGRTIKTRVRGTKQSSRTQEIASKNNEHVFSLRLCVLGCEEKVPYGPIRHTAQMFLDLIEMTLARNYPESMIWDVRMDVFDAKKSEFPSFEGYDGVILPGSYSGAYDEDEWIQRLKEEIRNVLLPRSIPTFGVCFGHQVLAHALEGGKAIKCPAGTQGGPNDMVLTDTLGKKWFSDEMELLYTHGDMVERLPSNAVALGGNDRVPIQAAAYFREDRVVFVTTQAHPEYASEGSEQPTLKRLLHMLTDSGSLTAEQQEEAERKCAQNWKTLERNSMEMMLQAGIQLGWFPKIE